MRTSSLALHVLGALAAGWLFAAPTIAAAELLKPVVGQPAPDFHAVTFDGRRINLADLKGQVVVLNFWATWCAPCRNELPLLDGYARMDKAVGLRVLAVDYHDDQASPAEIHRIADQASLSVIWRFTGPYAPDKGFPTSFIIDRAGIVRYIQLGAMDVDDMNAMLVPLLKEPPPAPAPLPISAPGPTH